MSKYEPFPENYTEEELLAAFDDPDVGIRMLALLHNHTGFNVLLRALDDRDIGIYEMAVRILQQRIKLISETVKSTPWNFWGKRNGELVFRRDEQRVTLTPDQFRQAVANRFFEIPLESGDTIFYAHVISGDAP